MKLLLAILLTTSILSHFSSAIAGDSIPLQGNIYCHNEDGSTTVENTFSSLEKLQESMDLYESMEILKGMACRIEAFYKIAGIKIPVISTGDVKITK